MEEGASDKQQLDYGQNNYTPLILSTIALFLIAVFTVSRYGNLRTQPWYVSTVCIIGWCFPFWIVLLLPLDFSSTLYDYCEGDCKRPFTHVSQDFLYVAWRTLYWCSFSLTWVLIPFLQSYVNTGDFTITKRVKSAIRVNLQFYSIYVVIGIVGLLYLIFASGYTTKEKIQGFVMAMANSWGLFLVIMFMGHGLVAVPWRLWFTGDVKRHLRQIYAKAPQTKEECIDSELEFDELAKTMNAVSHRPLRDDPHLRSRVDQMVKRFPFILNPEYSDRDNTVSVPRNITEEYLVKLSKDMIIASRMKDRKLALWKNLLSEAFYLQDIISNRENTDRRFHSTVRPLKETSRWNDAKACIEWWWILKIEPVLHRGVALLCACLSICILWSELVFNVKNPVLSIVALGLEACGFNYAAVEVTAFLTITYMCMCVYTSLFKVRFFNLYLLIPKHHTDENSLLWFTGYLCKMMAPLCYNYINLAGNSSTSADTVFNKFMGRADLVPFLGTTFIDWFPVVILIPALSVLLNFQGRCFGLCGVKDPYENVEGDPETGTEGSITSEVAEGKALISEERRLLERSINPDRNDQRGLFNRARSALGQCTSKYGPPSSPISVHSSRSLHAYPSQNRPSALSSNLRQERDRRIDEILSGRSTPAKTVVNGNADSDDEPEQTSAGGVGLQSFGDAVKNKISDIFQKRKPILASSAGTSAEPVATESEDDAEPLPRERHQTIRTGRILGRPSSNDFARSRSPSPDNRFALTANRANRASKPLSHFTRFSEEEEDVLTRNVFADL